MEINYFKKGIKIGMITGLIISLASLSYIYYVSKEHIKKSEEISKSKTFKELNLNLTDLDGKEFDINSIKSKKILVNFWATWCAPCIQEMPLLQNAYNIINTEYTFILISDEPIEKIKTFKEKKGYNFLFLRSGNNNAEKIGALPTTLLLDNDKNIYYIQAGSFENMSTQQFINFINNK
ncbi:Thiol-disulfide isomerase-like thioredoxin [Flavobacterium psychrophilum]|uniref:TlpA family protein disulfide reductase n=1 Tax=Flavobacterium psychrophilum TaxID=96345 RepID=UPI000B7C5340|nr:TlpA disulfide reductase family protein [Flavobacterium psychrophilum]SNB06000.1 Thiol-disulfide isomerase-like thioredoxin [Flavobacterium psychrophilum]